MEKRDALRYRIAPLEMTPSEFRKVGYQLVERIAEFLCTLPDRPVTPNESPRVIRDVRTSGMRGKDSRQLRVYTSSETHTWIHKATDMFGLGTDAIRWIPVDEQLRMDTTALRKQIHADIEAGDVPFLVIGTAGTVST